MEEQLEAASSLFSSQQQCGLNQSASAHAKPTELFHLPSTRNPRNYGQGKGRTTEGRHHRSWHRRRQHGRQARKSRTRGHCSREGVCLASAAALCQHPLPCSFSSVSLPPRSSASRADRRERRRGGWMQGGIGLGLSTQHCALLFCSAADTLPVMPFTFAAP